MSAITYDGTNRYIRITDIDNETHELIDTGETSPADFSSKYLLGEGDLLFARTGASVGKTYFYQSNKEKQYFAGYLIKFHFKNQITGKYVFYFTQTKNYKNWVSTFSKRSGQSGINAEEYSKLKLYIPVIKEQELIVQFLEDLDKKLNIVRTKLAILKKYKKGLSVLLIKQGIYCGKLADFVAVQEKTKLPSSYGNPHGLYPFFINNDENIEKYCDEYCFDGTYLILNTGGSASIKLYQGKFSVMSDCLVLKPKKNSIGLYYYLKSIEKKIDKVGFQGTGLRHLDQNWFFKQTIILPIIDENKLEKINLYLDAKTIILKKEIKILQKIKNYLLANLFI